MSQPQIEMHEPLFTFQQVAVGIRNFLAALGMVALSVCIGLYCAGFFTWLLEQK
jgi:hypothetical protein